MKRILFTLFCLTSLLLQASNIWEEGSQWDVNYTVEGEHSSITDSVKVTYRLLHADNNYMALEKTVTVNQVMETCDIQGYIRNEGDTLIYVRPVLDNGSIGDECLLFDFCVPYEYGDTIRYGIMGGEVKELFIDWQEDTMDYYMMNDEDTHCLPAWKGIIYQYGYIGGPMDLFLLEAAPGKTKQPKPTNISHVIFSTKGEHKMPRLDDVEDHDDDIIIPYDEMLTDGTTWQCLAVSTERSDIHSTYTIQVKGDTIIDNHRCKQAYSPEYDIQQTLYEEGRKVYLVDADGNPEVLLDFNLQEGDWIDGVTNVAWVRNQENLGYHYRTITIDTGLDCESYFEGDTEPWTYSLIEGIGVSKDQFLNHRFLNNNTISYLMKCWKQGKLVYQVSEYNLVDEIFTDSESSIIYDLQGHRLKAISQEGIYIIGNKKILVK